MLATRHDKIRKCLSARTCCQKFCQGPFIIFCDEEVWCLIPPWCLFVLTLDAMMRTFFDIRFCCDVLCSELCSDCVQNTTDTYIDPYPFCMQRAIQIEPLVLGRLILFASCIARETIISRKADVLIHCLQNIILHRFHKIIQNSRSRN